MAKTEDTVEVYCSCCRARIHIKELFTGKAVPIGRYCFCRSCAGNNRSRKVRPVWEQALRLEKLSLNRG